MANKNNFFTENKEEVLPKQEKTQATPVAVETQETKRPPKDKKPAYVGPFYSSNPKQMYTNCVTKFAFATKTGISPSNPKK